MEKQNHTTGIFKFELPEDDEKLAKTAFLILICLYFQTMLEDKLRDARYHRGTSCPGIIPAMAARSGQSLKSVSKFGKYLTQSLARVESACVFATSVRSYARLVGK
jgi:hypothetical protein